MTERVFSGGSDPGRFISDLVAVSLRAAAESRAQYAALASAEGRAEEGPVEVVVLPGGAIRTIEIVEEPSGYAASAIADAVRKAYRRAASRANAATAAAADPRLRDVVAQSVPDEVRAARADDPDEPTTSGSSRAAVPEQPTVADLPADPETDRLLAILDDEDPFRAIERLRSDPAVPHIDLNRSADEIDAEIRAQLETFAGRVDELTPALRAVRGTAESEVGSVTVDAWGALVSIELAASVRTRKASELSTALTRLVADATAAAGLTASALIRGEGITSPDDPVLAGLDHPYREDRA